MTESHDFFLIGNMIGEGIVAAEIERRRRADLRPMRHSLAWALDQTTGSRAEDSFDYGKHPVQYANWGGNMLFIADPDVVQTMMLTKNSQTDKTGDYGAVLMNFFGNSFLFSKGDDKWKAKRKGLGHAFYKDKLLQLVDTLKDYIHKQQTEWLEQIEASPSNSTQIDMSKAILQILQKFLMHVVVGSSQLDNTELTLRVKKVNATEFSSYKCSTLSEAIAIVWPQMIGNTDRTRLMNPLWHLMYKLTGKCYAFTELERTVDQNCAAIRSAIRDFVRKRASNQIKSDFASKSDVLSLMMDNSDVFDEEDIIDEVLDLLVAGTQTTQYATQFTLAHFMTDPESLKRARTEFEQVTKNQDPSATIKDQLNFELLSDLTYMGNVIYESLRFNPVAISTTMYYFENDTKLSEKFSVKANDNIIITMHGLHRNGAHWQRPNEFLPDRFDPSHPLSKTPKGERRSAYAFLPFSGGKRICFGKTFAECILKVILTMMTQTFDMKFVDEETYNKDSLPVLTIGMSNFPELHIELKKRM